VQCAINCLIDYAKLLFHHHTVRDFYYDDNACLKSLVIALPDHNDILVLNIYVGLSLPTLQLFNKRTKTNNLIILNQGCVSKSMLTLNKAIIDVKEG